MPINTGIVLGGNQQPAQRDPIQQLAALMQIMQAQKQGQLTDLELEQKRLTHPLTLSELQLKNEQHQITNKAIKDSLAPQVVGAQDQAIGVFQNKLKFAAALALADPVRGRAQMEAIKLEYPDIKWEGGIPLHPRTGQPIADAAIIPQINQQGFGTTKVFNPELKQYEVRVAPGAAEAFRQQQQIAEGVKAGSDLVTVPPTAPDQPPTYRSRAQLLPQASAPVQQGLPSEQQFMASPQFAAMPKDQQDAIRRIAANTVAGGPPMSVNVPAPAGGVAPLAQGALVPGIAPSGGVPAGMSPVQEASAAANKEFQVTDAKSRAQMYDSMQKGAMANQTKIAKVERIGNLLKDYDGGKLAQAGFELARYGTSLGIKIDDKLPNKEAAVALSNEVALELRSTADGSGMPGALSDADREFLKSMTPQLGQTAEGRRKIIESRVAVWKREQLVAEKARQYRQKYGSIDDNFFSQLQAWSNRNQIFDGNR